MDSLNPRARRDAFGSKINRVHSPLLAYGIPWATILLGSITPWLPILSPTPIIPPMALLIMLAWHLLRPGLLPLWAGLPLGLFDDLFSGQPLGSGILLFSLVLIAIDLIEIRFPWRSFWLDWLTATLVITIYLLACGLFSGASLNLVQLRVILPQLLLSIVLFPIIARMVSILDRVRLTRVRRIG